MLTPNILLRMINDAQIASGIDFHEFAKRSGVSLGRWRDLRRGRGNLSLEELPGLAKAVSLSFQIVAPHHEAFMQLTEEESKALLTFAERYKKDGPKPPHPLRSAVEKLARK